MAAPNLGELWDQAGDVAKELADPSDTSLPTQVRRSLCDAYASSSLSSLAVGPGGAIAADRVCGPYWEGQGVNPPEFAEGLPGGQCDGVLYRLAALNDAGVETAAFGDFTGPITQFDFVSVPPAGQVGTLTAEIASASNPSGGQFTISALGQDSAWGRSITRLDGLPDDCGKGPNTITPDPVNPGTPYGTPQTRPTFGGPVDITVSAPRTDIDGDTYFEVDVSVGDVSISPTFNIGLGPFEPALPAPGEPEAREGEPTEVTDPSGEIDDEPTEEEEEAGFETIGYRWDVLGIPPRDAPIPGSNPPVYPFVLGNVRLRYRGEGALNVIAANTRIYSSQGSVYRPDPSLKVQKVAYSINPGYSGLRLTPIRARRRESNGR